MKIKVITIDFWNTLFDSSGGDLRNNFRQKILFEQMDKSGVWIKSDEYDKAMKSTWEYFENIWTKEHRTPNAKDCVGHMWNYLELPKNEEAISVVEKSFAECVLVHPPKLLAGAGEVLQELSSKYELALVSDTGFSPGTILQQLMIESDIIKYFSVFSFSDETGVAKPHQKAFRTALEPFSVLSEEAVHIGDIEQTDIVGAKNFGMSAIRFTGSETNYVKVKNPTDSRADHWASSWDEVAGILL